MRGHRGTKRRKKKLSTFKTCVEVFEGKEYVEPNENDLWLKLRQKPAKKIMRGVRKIEKKEEKMIESDRGWQKKPLVH